MKENEVYPNVEPEGDKIYRLAEAICDLIPAGTTVLHSLISPPVQKRMEDWINKVEERLLFLEKENKINLSELANNDQFSALTLRAIQLAAISSQDDQLSALRNYIVNLALNPTVSEDERYIILEIIGGFTSSHIKALYFYYNPTSDMKKLVALNRSRSDPEKFAEVNLAQGNELAYIFEEGTPEYWQNIFWMLSGRHIVNNSTTMPVPNSPDIVIRGVITGLGKKVVEMILNDSP